MIPPPQQTQGNLIAESLSFRIPTLSWIVFLEYTSRDTFLIFKVRILCVSTHLVSESSRYISGVVSDSPGLLGARESLWLVHKSTELFWRLKLEWSWNMSKLGFGTQKCQLMCLDLLYHCDNQYANSTASVESNHCLRAIGTFIECHASEKKCQLICLDQPYHCDISTQTPQPQQRVIIVFKLLEHSGIVMLQRNARLWTTLPRWCRRIHWESLVLLLLFFFCPHFGSLPKIQYSKNCRNLGLMDAKWYKLFLVKKWCCKEFCSYENDDAWKLISFPDATMMFVCLSSCQNVCPVVDHTVIFSYRGNLTLVVVGNQPSNCGSMVTLGMYQDLFLCPSSSCSYSSLASTKHAIMLPPETDGKDDPSMRYLTALCPAHLNSTCVWGNTLTYLLNE